MFLIYERTTEEATVKSPIRVRAYCTNAVTKREQTIRTKSSQHRHSVQDKKLTKTMSTPNTLSINQRLLEILA